MRMVFLLLVVVGLGVAGPYVRRLLDHRADRQEMDRLLALQPFGGYLSNFREFTGFRLPTHIEAGNFFGTEKYFPFFIADVTDLRFPSEAR